MPPVDLWSLATILIAGIATLAIFSFLWRENPFYRFFEHLFIGVSAGIAPVLGIRDFFWPKIIEPMLGRNIDRYPDGTTSAAYEPMYLLYLLPFAFGLLYYTIYSRRFGWLAKVVIGFSLGVSGGMMFKGFFAEIIPQIWSSFRPLLVLSAKGELQLWSSFSNVLFVTTLLIVMYYFIFTFRTQSSGTGPAMKSARYLMMVCFGAFFGSTVMARLALLVERVQFLIEDWWRAVRTVASLIV
jgi:hypothetical protein